jgi:hypothetical protein
MRTRRTATRIRNHDDGKDAEDDKAVACGTWGAEFAVKNTSILLVWFL